MAEVALSVVVIGRNEGPRLLRCLDSIRLARWPLDYEVIYVDSASSDGSAQRAAAWGARVLDVRPQHPSAATGRNAGWRASNAEWILFLDGDTLLAADFPIAALNTAQADSSIAVVWGHRRELHPERSWYNRVLDLDWIYPAGDSEFCGGDALMRRSALVAVDGFDARLIAGEEPELCQRLRQRGRRIVHIDQMMTGHDLAMTQFRQYWRRAVRAGYAYAQIERQLRHSPTPLWRAEVRRNWRNSGVVLLLAVGLPLLSVLLSSPWPWLLGWMGLVGLWARTVQRCAWKGGTLATRCHYALHAHLQQLPIALGQLSYHWHRWRGRARGLIEYK